MQIKDTPEAAAFRAELGAWLEANAPGQRAEEKSSSGHIPEWAREWQRRLFDSGWLVPGWPPELGGRNASPVEQMVYFEEMARRWLPRSLNPQGLSIIAPSILDYGDEGQRKRYVLPTLRAEITWCLGMSEPEAGSDLASLRTRAVLDGDRFVVNGQKVWTSGAHDADYCFCFVRTDPEAPKHRGISALVIDMRSAGVVCRPLPDLTRPDQHDFNEVFFTDVVVPAENIVGELNRGWAITQGSLRHERGMLWVTNVTQVEQGVSALVGLGSEKESLGRDPRFREDVASLFVDTQAMRALGYRGFSKLAKGEDSVEATLLKLFTSEVERRLYLTGMDALGAESLDTERPGPSAPSGWLAGSWALDYLKSFSGTIAGGTSEIQRNIIAERALGMPRG